VTGAVVAIVDDLFFLAKIRETAKAVGVTVLTVDARRGTPAVAEASPQGIVLDLNLRSTSALDWIRTLKADPATQAIPIVAFVSHVQEQLISDARTSGCNSVLARSAFTRQLPQLLQDLVSEGNQNR
jgi:CheY-like chemotaxis protein